MTPDQAATELLCLAPSELPASQKIVLREAARTALKTQATLHLLPSNLTRRWSRLNKQKESQLIPPMSNDLRPFICGAMIGRIFGWWGCLVPLLLLIVAFATLAIFGGIMQAANNHGPQQTTTQGSQHRHR
jgi:hypothetical protein